jgi:hypothetical protein
VGTAISVLREVALQETLEAAAVASLVASHLVDGIVDSVVAPVFGELGEIDFALASAMLGGSAEFEVALGAIGYDLAKKLSKLRCVLSFLKSVSLERFGYFRVAFPLRDTAHGKVHTNFAALGIEVRPQVDEDVCLNALRNADYMLGGIGCFRGLLFELGRRSLALGASRRWLITLMHITTH